MNLMFQPLRKYADFTGRARRVEYWLFVLLNLLLVVTCNVIAGQDSVLGPLVVLALLLPNIALGVRRLHDLNLSGWFYLLGMIPFVGGIFLFVIALLPGTVGDNRFGPQPE